LRVLIAGLCLFMPLLAAATVNEDVLRAVETCNLAAKTFEEQRYCQIKATPRKCRNLVRRPQQGASFSFRHAWLKCVSTCEDATLFSRTFGECSTPSDPNK
jgi:hypothetical protein